MNGFSLPCSAPGTAEPCAVHGSGAPSSLPLLTVAPAIAVPCWMKHARTGHHLSNQEPPMASQPRTPGPPKSTSFYGNHMLAYKCLFLSLSFYCCVIQRKHCKRWSRPLVPVLAAGLAPGTWGKQLTFLVFEFRDFDTCLRLLGKLHEIMFMKPDPELITH